MPASDLLHLLEPRHLIGLHVVGVDVTLVSSAEACAQDVYEQLLESGLMRADGEPTYEFLTTVAPDDFASVGRRFLGPEMAAASQFAGGLA